MTEEPEVGLHRDERGIRSLSRSEDGSVQVLVTEADAGRTGEPTLRDLGEALVAAYGTDFGVHDPTFISRFTDMARQADAYRVGRVLLAGDAAHVHYPAGGQGLNIGMQDAVNLGWKLAQVIRGTSSDDLLDTYQAERHPVAAITLRNARAQVALLRPDPQTDALREIETQLLGMDEPRTWMGAMMSGLDVHYDLGDGHPLLGRRMPDLDLETDGGPTRVFTLLHEARPVLLNLGRPGTVEPGAWADRVRSVDATYTGALELPVLGPVPAPTAILIRPDGHVAWVGERAQDGLDDALVTWCGSPAAV
jgi:hypothetical protein